MLVLFSRDETGVPAQKAPEDSIEHEYLSVDVGEWNLIQERKKKAGVSARNDGLLVSGITGPS